MTGFEGGLYSHILFREGGKSPLPSQLSQNNSGNTHSTTYFHASFCLLCYRPYPAAVNGPPKKIQIPSGGT